MLRVFVDYRDIGLYDLGHVWIPPSSSRRRFSAFASLQAATYVVLLTGLSYYCPWDLFAWLTVPDFSDLILDSDSTPYFWLFAPVFMATKATPLAGYMLCFLLSIAGFVLFPPLLFFTLYFDRIVALESLWQEVKATKRTYD